MTEQPVSFGRETRRRFVRVVKDFLTSEVRWWARGLFALLFGFALAVNGLNVVNSYVGRDFMTRSSLQQLDENSITYVTLAEVAESVDLYDALLEIDADGAWRWKRIDVGPQCGGGQLGLYRSAECGSSP
jgi:putative ATP-binding cassette transporter